MLGGGSMSGRIVVGVDGSEGSLRALGWAVAEAVAREAVLQPVMAWQMLYDSGEMRDVPVDEARLAEGAVKRLEQLLAGVAGGDRAARVDPLVVRGDPAQLLCKRSAGADLLVVGARGHGGFRGLMLGSVSLKCAHHSRCPLVIVRGGRQDRARSPIRRILVGVDGSEGSRRALAWAVGEAALHGASVQALEVWRDPSGGDVRLGSGMEHFREDRRASPGQAQERLAAAIAEVAGRGPGVEIIPLVLQGDTPARTLCERSADADLLVIGSRGHGGFAGLLLGSVGTTCTHHSRCPVAIVPMTGRADGTDDGT
jgi:nucleotide-binding universal stress UspA family protein